MNKKQLDKLMAAYDDTILKNAKREPADGQVS